MGDSVPNNAALIISDCSSNLLQGRGGYEIRVSLSDGPKVKTAVVSTKTGIFMMLPKEVRFFPGSSIVSKILA